MIFTFKEHSKKIYLQSRQVSRFQSRHHSFFNEDSPWLPQERNRDKKKSNSVNLIKRMITIDFQELPRAILEIDYFFLSKLMN